MKTPFEKARKRFLERAAPLVRNCTVAEILAYAFGQGSAWQQRRHVPLKRQAKGTK